MKAVVLSRHERLKFGVLKQHGFIISADAVEAAVRAPDKIEQGYKGRKIAQKVIDESHVIRVVFEDFPDVIRVITFYPGRRDRYEDKL